MTTTPNSLPAGNRAGRSGKRHWFQITGLPGWRRAQLGLPAFGKADCSPSPGVRANTAAKFIGREEKS